MLMSHSMKIWERIFKPRLGQEVEIYEEQYSFVPGKSTADAIFALRILLEKYTEGQKKFYCVFVDLEKAYNWVARDELKKMCLKSQIFMKHM